MREITGFAIGDIPPLGHAQPLSIYMDEDLLAKNEIWAAAGTPRCIFATTPQALKDATGAAVINVKG
ncbi:YbaK/EbsC family protein [Breoghania sp.]|uniref:YbaK/EbsC family protein n=1 Tax=Breoghania sp. TaxID=2065378 RepID=UPI002632A8B2|nr:YbaK/EbsC family protein [Breoghania sp.]MDJ0931596.1 YbaK/EbsC family protein [Breoghania sp.]